METFKESRSYIWLNHSDPRRHKLSMIVDSLQRYYLLFPGLQLGNDSVGNIAITVRLLKPRPPMTIKTHQVAEPKQ